MAFLTLALLAGVSGVREALTVHEHLFLQDAVWSLGAGRNGGTDCASATWKLAPGKEWRRGIVYTGMGISLSTYLCMCVCVCDTHPSTDCPCRQG